MEVRGVTPGGVFNGGAFNLGSSDKQDVQDRFHQVLNGREKNVW